MALPLEVLTSAAQGAADLYHPPAHSDTALDTLLAVLASLALLLAMVIPAALARGRETRRMAADGATEAD